MDIHKAIQAMRSRHCLQIHCDGGFSDNIGAAACVVHIVDPVVGELTRAGYCGVCMAYCASAFHAELTAIEHGVNFVLNLKLSSSLTTLKRKVVFTDI